MPLTGLGLAMAFGMLSLEIREFDASLVDSCINNQTCETCTYMELSRDKAFCLTAVLTCNQIACAQLHNALSHLIHHRFELHKVSPSDAPHQMAVCYNSHSSLYAGLPGLQTATDTSLN